MQTRQTNETDGDEQTMSMRNEVTQLRIKKKSEARKITENIYTIEDKMAMVLFRWYSVVFTRRSAYV